MTRYSLPDAIFTAAQERAIKEAQRCQANTDAGNCPVCGDPGTCDESEPVMRAHNEDDHSLCCYSI
jgi:hypothetical protein